MKKLIAKMLLLVVCFMSFTSLVNAHNSQITIDDIVAYTKAALENLKDSNGNYKYTNVNAYADSAKKMIEVEFTYLGETVKTGIEYDENLTIKPGVHTLKDAMNVAQDNHTNCTIDTAMDILIIFNPKNNKLFANFVNYTEKDINDYFDENNTIENGYENYVEGNVCANDNCFLVNFKNFNLGRDAVAPKQEFIKNGNSIVLKTSTNMEDGTIVHIYRSLDNINFEEYKDIVINNNIAELTLNETDANYYYKSVVERSNNWSDVVKYEKETVEEGTIEDDTLKKDTLEKEPDKPTENPKTGSKEIISIVLIFGITLLFVYNFIKKHNKINNI